MQRGTSVISLGSRSAGALAALAAIGATVVAAPSRGAPPPRGAGKVYRPAPGLVRKTPTTDFDRTRIEAAERKRARKADKRLRDAFSEAAGYYFRPKAKPEPVVEATEPVKPKRARRKAA